VCGYLGWGLGGEGKDPGVRRTVDVQILFQQLSRTIRVIARCVRAFFPQNFAL